jgi:hypothetical protein
MYLRKILVRQLLRLYPALWRKEYGEEMRSMLLAQPVTASVIGDVFLNAMRQNLRRPDRWKIAALFLICWRSFWIVLPSIFQLSPSAWALFVQVDRVLFLLVALFTGCWTVIKEGDVYRGALAGWWSTIPADFIPEATVLLLISVAPNKTIPGWTLVAIHHFTHWHYLLTILASLCGALLGHLARKRLMATVDTQR